MQRQANPSGGGDPAGGWASFVEAVRQAVEVNNQAFRRWRTAGRYRTPSFDLARALKPHPLLAGLDGVQAADQVHTALAEIYEESEHQFLWETAIGHNNTEGAQADPLTDFVYCWDNCGDPREGALASAVAAAKANARPAAYFGSRFAQPKWRDFREFLAVAEELQRAAGDAPFFLAQAPVGEQLGVAAQQVSRWCSTALRYGILTLESEHRPGKARAYSFVMPDPDAPEG
jgi:hypothetical protein